MFSREMNIADFDPELADAMSKEVERQEHHIELIASENYCSPRVMQKHYSVQTTRTFNRTLVHKLTLPYSWHYLTQAIRYWE